MQYADFSTATENVQCDNRMECMIKVFVFYRAATAYTHPFSGLNALCFIFVVRIFCFISLDLTTVKCKTAHFCIFRFVPVVAVAVAVAVADSFSLQ